MTTSHRYVSPVIASLVIVFGMFALHAEARTVVGQRATPTSTPVVDLCVKRFGSEARADQLNPNRLTTEAAYECVVSRKKPADQSGLMPLFEREFEALMKERALGTRITSSAEDAYTQIAIAHLSKLDCPRGMKVRESSVSAFTDSVAEDQIGNIGLRWDCVQDRKLTFAELCPIATSRHIECRRERCEKGFLLVLTKPQEGNAPSPVCVSCPKGRFDLALTNILSSKEWAERGCKRSSECALCVERARPIQ